MKTKLTKILAGVLAAAMMLSVVPAQGAKAVGQVAKKIITCVVEPTLVYENIYGFYNGISSVTDTNKKQGVIDVTGKEVVPCGLYNNIVVLTHTKGFLAKTTATSNGVYCDAAGNVLKDFGPCDSIRSINNSNDPNVYVPAIKVVTGTSAKIFDYNGNLLGEIADTSDIYDKLGKIYKDSSSIDDNTYLCTNSDRNDENRTYYIVDASLNVIKTIENCLSAYVIGKGYYVVNGKETVVDKEDEDFTYDNYYLEVYDAKGNVVIDRQSGYDTFSANWNTVGYIYAKSYENSTWVVFDGKGNKIKELGKYDGISSDDYGSILLYNYVDKENYSDKDYYYVKSIDSAPVHLGVYSWIYVSQDYANNTKYMVASRKVNDKELKDVFTTDGVKIFNSDAYAAVYDNISIESSQYVIAGKNMPKIDGKYNGKEKAVLMKYDGTVVFDAGQCDYMYYTGDGIHVTYMNKDSSEFAMDGSLIITYEKSKYDSMGWVGDDGYVPIKIGGKWGIYRVIDNPALKPLATQAPVVNQTKSITAPAAVKKVGIKAARKKMTITLPKKSGGVKGYVIQYSLNKKFKKASKVTVTKNKAVIKKLKSGKKYYVRVKAYKLNGKKKVLSKKWSKVKTVKVK